MGKFIVSLDCEGKWGMADALEPYHHALLTDDSLAAVYEQIKSLFARYEIAATFAFVMAFTLAPAQRPAFAQLLDRDPHRKDEWLSYYWRALEEGHGEGWFQARALETIRAEDRHEIACHGFCHRPLGDESLSEAEAEAEIDAALAVAAMQGVELRTFVYPRNEIGHLDVLRRAGFLGYRERLRRPVSGLGRALRLSEEFNLWPSRQHVERPGPDGLVAIPPGYFFNWRFGARRRVPAWVTVRRWRNLIGATARSGGVAHLWFHPHNLITAPDTARSLETVLAYAARLRDAGKLEIVTQRDYCREVLASSGSPAGPGGRPGYAFTPIATQ